ncbi:MAG TPA: ABC transporter permease [Anaerolineales bacterium]|jgi:ABC-type polysaccharide/polyol phosphate export permease
MPDARRQWFLAILLNGLPGWLLVLAGLALSAVSLLADNLGLGAQAEILGWKQVVGAAAGALLASAGAWLGVRISTGTTPDLQSSTFDVGLGPADDQPIYDSAAPRVPFLHELSELYRYRYLLRNLVGRDLKVRYKRSVLGFFWAMVNPLLTMAVLVVVFTNLFRFEVENYPIFLLSGILLWRLFAEGTSQAMRSVLGNSGLSKKIYIPNSVFVAASLGSAVIHFLFAAFPLLVLALITGVAPQVSWAYLVIPVIQTTLFAFGIGLVTAALAVFFADMLDIYDVLLNAYYFLTPIIYPIAILPEFLRRVQALNPMHSFITAFRDALIAGQWPNLESTLTATIIALLVTAAGWSLFTRLSDQFAYQV